MGTSASIEPVECAAGRTSGTEHHAETAAEHQGGDHHRQLQRRSEPRQLLPPIKKTNSGPPPETPPQFQRPQLTASALGALPLIKAIQNIFIGKGLEKFLDDLSPRDLVDYVVNHSTHIASDERKLSIIGQKLSQIPINSENQSAFASLRFRDAMLSVASTIRDADTVYWLASGLLAVTASTNNVRLYSFRPLRNTLVHLAWHAKSPASVEAVGQLFAKFSEGGGNDQLFATPAVRDAFCCMADHCLSPAAICAWCTALLNTAASPESAEMFCVPEIRAAALKIAKVTLSPDATLAVCALLAAMAFSETGRRLFGTRQVLEALIALSDHAVVAEAVECWAKAVLYVSSDDLNRALFGVEPMHNALARLAEHATTPSSVQWLSRALAGLCLLGENENMLCSRPMRCAVQHLGRTVMRHHRHTYERRQGGGQISQRGGTNAREEYRDGPLAIRLSSDIHEGDAAQLPDAPQHHIDDDAVQGEDVATAAMWLCNAVINLTSTDEHKMRMSHERVRDALVDAGPACSGNPLAERALTHALFNITKCTQRPELFTSRSFRALIADTADGLRDSESAAALLGTIVSMTRTDESRIICGGSRMHACLVALSDLVQSSECAAMWWKAIGSIFRVEMNRSHFGLDQENVVTALLVVVRASRSVDSIVAMGSALEVVFSAHYGDRLGVGRCGEGTMAPQPTSTTAGTGRPVPRGTSTQQLSTWPISTVAVAASKFMRHGVPDHGGRRHAAPASGPGSLSRGGHLHQSEALRDSTMSPVFTAGAYYLPCSDFRDALLSIHTYAVDADAVRWLSHTLYIITIVAIRQGEAAGGSSDGVEGDSSKNRHVIASASVMCTVGVRDACIALSRSAHSADAVRWLCKLLNTIARYDACRELLVSPHLQKALVDMKRSATTPDAVHQLSCALSVVTKLIEDSSFADVQEGLGTALLEDALSHVRAPSQRVAGKYFYQSL